MTAAVTTVRQKLLILASVTALHALVFWSWQTVSARRVEPDVFSVQIVTPPVPAPAPSLPPKASPELARRRPAAPLSSSPVSAAPPMPVLGATSRPLVPVDPATPAATPPAATLNNASAVAANASVAGSTATPSAPIELPLSNADYLHNPKPEYPRLSRQRNEQGRVVVNVYISTDGVALKAEVKVSSGFERLDAAALATAKAWRYVPGKRGGVPEAMWFAVPINYVME